MIRETKYKKQSKRVKMHREEFRKNDDVKISLEEGEDIKNKKAGMICESTERVIVTKKC